jgi:glycosyltransferase involved in cell wall biosynthesis
MKDGVTVLICTYNGSRRLAQTLQHLAAQKVGSDLSWNILLVDNASTDGSAEIAQELWETYGAPAELRVYNQPVPGLNPSREAGFQQADHEFIIACDDDNWLQQDFVATAYAIMKRNPSIAVLGSLGELVYEVEAPAWLSSYCIYASGPQAPQNGKVESNKVYGAGSIVRKSAYQKIIKAGFKSLLTDRMASTLTSGGDHEFCYAFALAGYDIWYDDRLKFKHFIEKERISWKYYRRYIKESARCFEVLEPYKILSHHGNLSDLELYAQLTRSFGYHVKRLMPTWLGYTFGQKDSWQYHANYIQHQLLLTRLKSYYLPDRLVRILANFSKVKAFKNRLEHLQSVTTKDKKVVL